MIVVEILVISIFCVVVFFTLYTAVLAALETEIGVGRRRKRSMSEKEKDAHIRRLRRIHGDDEVDRALKCLPNGWGWHYLQQQADNERE